MKKQDIAPMFAHFEFCEDKGPQRVFAQAVSSL